MNSWIDLRGASGTLYRYTLAEDAKPKTPVSGTYIYLRAAKPEPQVIYAGDTLNLSEGALELWPQAVKEFGATHMYLRLNVARAARKAELADLFDVETPPMNERAPSEST